MLCGDSVPGGAVTWFGCARVCVLVSKVVAERLRKNATLTSLDLSSNALKSEGASYIAEVSFRCTGRHGVNKSLVGALGTPLKAEISVWVGIINVDRAVIYPVTRPVSSTA